ncbi:hypothetical protein BDW42DRAFT_173867 [Aspergillus taichungensis]|uniref:Uncharacterized protein n=1 Tax=Aspergillus taichungensis TaxID=482145 RepID=A0A2J5HP56_9EURO|nr:hypothetical protein BDW42DRAFT_173867 [Aspergillus taichungensis]
MQQQMTRCGCPDPENRTKNGNPLVDSDRTNYNQVDAPPGDSTIPFQSALADSHTAL